MADLLNGIKPKDIPWTLSLALAVSSGSMAGAFVNHDLTAAEF